MRIGIIIIKFVFISGLLIIANHNLNLNDPIERGVFYTKFFGWFDHMYQRSLGIVGFVVRSEWLPQENNLSDAEVTK